jgi:hypothetical protein
LAGIGESPGERVVRELAVLEGEKYGAIDGSRGGVT